MSQALQPYSNPEATPVGHLGTRVDIHERQAWAISGWLGVLAVAVCIGAAILLAHTSVKALIAVPGPVPAEVHTESGGSPPMHGDVDL